MLSLVSLIVFLWSTLWTLRSLKRMLAGDNSILHPIIFVSYAFLAAPLGYDLAFGLPDLRRYPGLAESVDYIPSVTAYLLLVALAFPLINLGYSYRAKRVEHLEFQTLQMPVWISAIARLALWAPILMVLFAPDPSVYFKYAVSQGEDYTPIVAEFHTYISAAGRVATVSGIAVVLGMKRITLVSLFWVVLPLAGTAWLNGKRSAVAMIIAGLLFALWQRRVLRGPALAVAGILAIVFLGVFSSSYQDEYRSELASAGTYEGFRIDYGRDIQAKMALRSLQDPDFPDILQYRGQTLPLYFLQYVPRVFWPEKPLPYAQYFTSTVFHSPPKEWGWGFTTGWYVEWLSNIGIVAIIVAPLLMGLLCRFANKIIYPLTRTGLMVILILLNVQHANAFYILIPGVVILYILEKSATLNTWSGKRAEVK